MRLHKETRAECHVCWVSSPPAPRPVRRKKRTSDVSCASFVCLRHLLGHDAEVVGHATVAEGVGFDLVGVATFEHSTVMVASSASTMSRLQPQVRQRPSFKSTRMAVSPFIQGKGVPKISSSARRRGRTGIPPRRGHGPIPSCGADEKCGAGSRAFEPIQEARAASSTSSQSPAA